MCIQFTGLIVGAISWLKNLLVGDDAPLRVIQSSIELLGYTQYTTWLQDCALLITCTVSRNHLLNLVPAGRVQFLASHLFLEAIWY